MDKNIKLLYCILGSTMLALLNNSIFEYSKLGLFSSGYGGHLLGELLVGLSNILSLIGFILVAVFSIILIIRNIDLK
ncbi:hypothetical protein [Clostridium uliginosum]|nr:hypothetical protein [Clostridium uliginosum]